MGGESVPILVHVYARTTRTARAAGLALEHQVQDGLGQDLDHCLPPLARSARLLFVPHHGSSFASSR
jgi:hypothetical protein